MVKNLTSYFLGNLVFEDEFERNRISFLFALLSFAFAAHAIYLFQHQFLLHKGLLFLVGDSFGLAGIFFSLIFIRFQKIFTAGWVLIIGISINIFIDNVVADYYSLNAQLNYARIYISATELIFLSIVAVTFIVRKELFILLAFVWSFLLIGHFFALYLNPTTYTPDKVLAFSYLFGLLGIIKATALICYFILMHIERVSKAYKSSLMAIEKQNEELELTVKARTLALEQSNESLREFAYVVSHDLKEPLRTVNGFVSLARRSLSSGKSDKEELDMLLQHAAKGTEQLEHLIRDILEFSRLSNVVPELRKVQLSEIIDRVQERLNHSISNAQATIEIEKLPEVKGEKNLLTQLFQNLISNAVKYRHELRKPIVKIYTRKIENDFCEIVVEDNGIGIPNRFLEVIFQPFKRIHASGNEYDGTGIGLSICLKIAQLHGGKISVESEEGVGSKFIVKLPI